MNNKGQSLALFVVIIPLIIIVFVVLVDISRLYYEKSKLDNINMYVLNNYIDRNDIEIEQIIKKNDEDVIDINIDHSKNEITITKYIDTIFIGVLDKNEYEIKSVYKIENEKIVKG